MVRTFNTAGDVARQDRKQKIRPPQGRLVVAVIHNIGTHAEVFAIAADEPFCGKLRRGVKTRHGLGRGFGHNACKRVEDLDRTGVDKAHPLGILAGVFQQGMQGPDVDGQHLRENRLITESRRAMNAGQIIDPLGLKVLDQLRHPPRVA